MITSQCWACYQNNNSAGPEKVQIARSTAILDWGWAWIAQNKQIWRRPGHVNDYPRKQNIGIPGHTESLIAYKALTEYFWKFQWKIALWELRIKIGHMYHKTYTDQPSVSQQWPLVSHHNLRMCLANQH